MTTETETNVPITTEEKKRIEKLQLQQEQERFEHRALLFGAGTGLCFFGLIVSACAGSETFAKVVGGAGIVQFVLFLVYSFKKSSIKYIML